MKNLYVNDLKAGDVLTDELFLLKDMVRRKTKDDRLYILCTLGDKTGQIPGVFWDLPEQIDQWLRPGQVLYATGKVNKYKDSIQVSLTDVYPQEHPDLSDYLPSSSRSSIEMVAELRDTVVTLRPGLQHLLTNLLLEENFLHRFANAPAARMMHHACIGGLLEHTLSMAQIADHLAGHYPHVDRDLLVAGALVHDMGKVWEYSIEGSFDVTDDGRLVGHIVRAIVEIEKAALQVEELPAEDLQHLVHLVASHHGTFEWASPVKPKTIEAILLHQVDLLDSRVQGFFDHLENDGSEIEWTSKSSPMHGVYLRKPNGWEE